MCTCEHLRELTGICKNAFEVWDFIPFMAFLVFKMPWPPGFAALIVKINSRHTLRERKLLKKTAW